MIDVGKARKHIDQCWGDEIVPTLAEYIKIPNKSPAFDPDWAAHGYMEEAVSMFERWARAKLPSLPGATLETVRLPGRTPVIVIDVPGAGADTVLLYGHLDKQPEMKGWTEGFGPWVPRLEGDKLYGRGGADDGYAMFGALSANLRRARQQLCGFLLRQGCHYGRPGWTKLHRRWLASLKFDQAVHHLVLEDYIQAVEAAEARRDRLTAQIAARLPEWSLAPVVAALQTMRGMALVNAATLIAELGDLSRFANPRQLMA